MTKEAQGLPQDKLVEEIEAGSFERLDTDGFLLGRMPTILEKKAAALIRSLSEENAALTRGETKWKEAVQGEYNRAEHHKLIRETAEAALSIATLEIDRLNKQLVIANAQLSDMEFLSVEGFLGWKKDRTIAALKAEENE